MSFDFTSVLERRGFDALAVEAPGHDANAPEAPDEGFDFIPMWVADMNFATAPAITRAIIERAQHPAFGYFAPRQEYFSAIIAWQKARNGVGDLKASHIGYENGVLGGVMSAMAALAAPGDAVLLHSPTYIGFTHCLEDGGYRIVHSPLVLKDGMWRMDFADMAEKLERHHIHVAVFCSPHNPCGRVWTKDEIEQAMEIYRSHDCLVISDEIWSDLLLPGYIHTPTQSISEDARQRTVALYAPSKTFNLAGLVGSYHIIYNRYLKDRVCSCAAKSHYNAMNVLSMHALIGALSSEGADWLDELRKVIATNVELSCSFFETHNFGISVARPEGTYMLFLDCGEWCYRHGCGVERLLKAGWKVGVGWQDGRPFHGEHHIRMNLALPTSRVEEALNRLAQHVFID